MLTTFAEQCCLSSAGWRSYHGFINACKQGCPHHQLTEHLWKMLVGSGCWQQPASMAFLKVYPARQEEGDVLCHWVPSSQHPTNIQESLFRLLSCLLEIEALSSGRSSWTPCLGGRGWARATPSSPPRHLLLWVSITVWFLKISSRGKQSKLVENNVKGWNNLYLESGQKKTCIFIICSSIILQFSSNFEKKNSNKLQHSFSTLGVIPDVCLVPHISIPSPQIPAKQTWSFLNGQ